MRHKKLFATAALAAAIALTGAGAALAHGGGPGRGGFGFRGGFGPGMGGHFWGARPFAARPLLSLALAFHDDLKLTDQQTAKLENLRDEFTRRAIRERAAIQEMRIGLRRALDADKVDLADVEKRIRDIAAKRTDLRIARLKAIDAGRTTLTQEQRDQLRTLVRTRAPWGGRFGMMGQGFRHGGFGPGMGGGMGMMGPGGMGMMGPGGMGMMGRGGYGMMGRGYGMMGRGGYGMGPGMMGPGYGRGTGSGAGQGYGPGMMGPGYGRGYGPGAGQAQGGQSQ